MDNEPQEPIGAEVVREMRRSRLRNARSEYEAIINRLWAGCGGGLIAVVTATRYPTDALFWFSAGAFGLGVLFLAAGAAWALAIELVQTGMTELPMIAEACNLPLDTVEEIAAAHARNEADDAPDMITPLVTFAVVSGWLAALRLR